MTDFTVRVWMNPSKGKKFNFNSHEFIIKNSELEEVFLDIIGKSDSTLDTFAWENDMVDAVLDGFKGTDLKMLNRIEY